jgi:hypothetical protein
MDEGRYDTAVHMLNGLCELFERAAVKEWNTEECFALNTLIQLELIKDKVDMRNRGRDVE